MAGLEERLWSRREDRAGEDCLGKAKRSTVLALRCENNPLNQSNPTLKIKNLSGHQNCIIYSKVTAILLNGWVLPIGGVALGRACACSLGSWLIPYVIFFFHNF